jgi:hypothetical protein
VRDSLHCFKTPDLPMIYSIPVPKSSHSLYICCIIVVLHLIIEEITTSDSLKIELNIERFTDCYIANYSC